MIYNNSRLFSRVKYISLYKKILWQLPIVLLLSFNFSAWSQPSEQNSRFFVLENENCEFSISKDNGALSEGWDKVSNTKLMTRSSDLYRIEKQTGVTNSQERYDSVMSCKMATFHGLPAIFLTCSNDALPSLIIKKRYVLGPGKTLSKRVAFSTSDEKGFFVEYSCETNLDPEYRNKINYTGFDIGYQYAYTPLYRLPKIEQPGGIGIVTAKDFSVGLAGYRYRINDRFVIRRGVISMFGRGSIMDTPTGWKEKVFTDYLQSGQEVSVEVRWVIFNGDFTVFERGYQNLPEYKELFNYSHPAWVKRVVADVMYLTGKPKEVQFFKELAPSLATEAIWFLNPPWGNWGAFDNPPVTSPRIPGIAPGMRKHCPNAKISAYTIDRYFDENSVIYQKHPDFGITSQNGELLTGPIASDAKKATTFYKQLLAPGCRDFYINQYRERLREWKMDFIYIDTPGVAEIPDWKLMDVCQWSDWVNYLMDLRKGVQEENPKAAVFTNGINVPQSDFGYIEWRRREWRAMAGSNWQSFAYRMMVTKLNESQGHVTVPLYGVLAAEPAYSTYTIAWGWCHMPRDRKAPDINRLPFARAAWEFRDSQLVEDAINPRWWRSGDKLETYGLRKGELGLVTVISHYNSRQDVKITVNPEKLGLKIGKPFYAWLLKMNDPGNFSGSAAFTVQKLTEGESLPKSLELTVSTEPMLLRVVVLTQTPAVLESVNGKLTQTGMTEHLDVHVSGYEKANVIELNIDCQTDNCTIVIPGLTTAMAEVNVSSIEDTSWAGLPALRISFNRGKHSVRVHKLIKKK